MSYLSATDEGASRLLFMASRIMATPFAIYNYVDLLLRRILYFCEIIEVSKEYFGFLWVQHVRRSRKSN